MNVCRQGHDSIVVFEGEKCPLCEIQQFLVGELILKARRKEFAAEQRQHNLRVVWPQQHSEPESPGE